MNFVIQHGWNDYHKELLLLNGRRSYPILMSISRTSEIQFVSLWKRLPCSVHHVLCVALLKSFFNWCTELASGSPLRIPVFSEHYTWIIPLDVPEARFWALFPDDEEGKQIFLISNKLIELLFKTFSQKC